MESETAFQQRLETACALAETSLEEAFGEQRTEWINRLEAKHDELVGLLQELLERGDAEAGLHLTTLLQELWFEPQHTAEGLDWLRRFLVLPATQARTALRASGLDLTGAYALNLGDYRQARLLEEEALGIFRECGNPEQVAYIYALPPGAFKRLCSWGLSSGASALSGRAGCPVRRQSQRGYSPWTGECRHGFHWNGRCGGGGPLIAESLSRHSEMGSLYNMMLSLRRAAAVAAGLGLEETSLRLAGTSDRQRLALGVSEPEVFLQAYARMLEPARNQLDEASLVRLWEEGAALSLEEAVAIALQALSH
jgi:hypothetical protein